MTVTFVLPFVNLTGGIRVHLDYANALHDAGHDVHVVYPAWPYRFHLHRSQQWHEFRKQARSPVRVPWFPLRARLTRVPVIRSVFLPRADVVIAVSWPVAHDVARLARSCGRKVHIVMHHESGTGPERRVRQVYDLPFYRIAYSHEVARAIERQFGCVIDRVVPNGVDPAVFYPDGPRDDRTVLMLYHPDPRKGAADGLEAIRRLRQRHPEVKIEVTGTVRPDPPLASTLDQLPFEFHPDDRRLRALYSQATVLLYPSRYEGFGLPPLEAMACGCPVVTTAVGAVPEFAVDGENALVVAPGDVAGLARGLERVVMDPALRARLSERGRATARRFALGEVAPLFERAISQAARIAST